MFVQKLKSVIRETNGKIDNNRIMTYICDCLIVISLFLLVHVSFVPKP